MRKFWKSFFCLTLAGTMVIPFVACKGGADYSEAFALKYDMGMDDYQNYDSDKFMTNVLNTIGADPGVIYVSEEDDEVYGGYFYAYITGQTSGGFTPGTGIYPSDTKTLAYQCFRTRDLSTWELCGAVGGYAIAGQSSDWEEWTNCWAPEVIYNASDAEYPYYMYYTTTAKVRTEGRLACNPDASESDRIHIGIARSETPVGPFIPYSDTEVVNGVTQKIPFIDFKYGFGLDYEVGVIDVSPFLDDDGELYLYFKTESFETGSLIAAVFGMKMNDWTHPIMSPSNCWQPAVIPPFPAN